MAGIVIDNRGLQIDEIEEWFETYYIKLAFDKDSGPSQTLKELEATDLIEEVVIVVMTAFDPGFTLSIGFPANNTEIVDTTENDLTTTGVFKYFPYRESLLTETLTAYFAGVSAGGAGYIFVKI
jgi:hypothetical protein